MRSMGGMADMSMDAYTINGHLFPHTRALQVRRGQRLEIVFVNESTAAT